MNDQKVFNILAREEERQRQGINLIASENYMSQDVRDVVGSVFAHKYVEGYPLQRYYSGCSLYDQIELLAIDRFKKIFGAEHVNVQPHSGSQANAAVYLAVLKPGDTILSMGLSFGGHLSHGHKVTWMHQFYNVVSYGVDSKSYCLDYDHIEKLAQEHKPKIIIAGASAYSRSIDFERFADIAHRHGALLLADIAHIAGLVAAGLHQSPLPYADIVTMTTHKTFRGPRGGVIMCKELFAKKIDKMLMPGMQGGALMNNVAAKAVAAYEAMQPEFIKYQHHVVKHAKIIAHELVKKGYKVITQGTDNHMILVDLTALRIDGYQAEKVLESVSIFINRNTIPFDTKSPLRPSGIRIGTPAITTLGADEKDIHLVVEFIDRALKNCDNQHELEKLALEVQLFMCRFLPFFMKSL
jgi:glycine hydroxymethyltransferase